MIAQIKMNGAAFLAAYVQSFATPKDFIDAVDPVIYAHVPAQREQLLTDIWNIGQLSVEATQEPVKKKKK